MAPEPDRGETYADGGFESVGRVFYPDPERMKRINDEWSEDE